MAVPTGDLLGVESLLEAATGSLDALRLEIAQLKESTVRATLREATGVLRTRIYAPAGACIPVLCSGAKAARTSAGRRSALLLLAHAAAPTGSLGIDTAR